MRKPDARDLSYEALTGVSAATAAQAREANQATEDGQGRFIEVIFPLVIVEGRLLEAYLDKKTSLQVEEISSGTLVWRNPAAGSVHSIIRIVTLPALEDAIHDALETATTLLEQDQAAMRALARAPDA